MGLEDIFVPLAGIGAGIVAIVVIFSSRHRERMAMIEKGLSSDEIKAMYTRDIRRDPLGSLKWGLIFVLAGMAVMLGVWLRDNYFANDGIIVGMVCLFVGIGLVVFYTIATKKAKG